ncbi:MAG: PrgI family protein [Candidatus Paceibacterota bacterium]
MRFHIPQYIEVESKLFGPLTLKQFIYLAGGAGGSAALWFLIPYPILSIILIIPLVLFSLALAFYKVNEKPFIEVLEAAFYYAVNSKLFIWDRHRRVPTQEELEEADERERLTDLPKLSSSKLKDMTWDLDVDAGNSTEEDEALETDQR